MRVLWLPDAVTDLERVYEFLRERDPAAGARALRAIHEAADRLAAHPDIGRPIGDRTHRRELYVPFGAGAYVLRYRVHHDDVVVIRLWHSREARD